MKVKDTARLSFTLMTEDDAELLYQLDKDPEVMRYLNGGKQTSLAEIVNTYIPRLKKFTNPTLGWGLWKVTVKANQDYIGWILIRPMEFFSQTPEFDNLEIGWRFMQKSWGKGYASEAALAVQNEVIKHGTVNKISATAVKENAGSIAVMEKIGLRYVKSYLHKDPLGDMQAVYYQKSL